MAVLSAVALLALAGVGTAIGLTMYANAYQPLGPGSFERRGGLHARVLTDGVRDTRAIIVGDAGTVARFEFSLRNSGSHDVRLLGLPQDSGVDRLAWGPGLVADQLIGGTVAESRPFPMTLRAGSEISLWVYVTQPNCTGGGTGTYTAIPIRWSAFGVHHVYRLPLDGNTDLPITNCAPKSALQHIDHS